MSHPRRNKWAESAFSTVLKPATACSVELFNGGIVREEENKYAKFCSRLTVTSMGCCLFLPLAALAGMGGFVVGASADAVETCRKPPEDQFMETDSSYRAVIANKV